MCTYVNEHRSPQVTSKFNDVVAICAEIGTTQPAASKRAKTTLKNMNLEASGQRGSMPPAVPRGWVVSGAFCIFLIPGPGSRWMSQRLCPQLTRLIFLNAPKTVV